MHLLLLLYYCCACNYNRWYRGVFEAAEWFTVRWHDNETQLSRRTPTMSGDAQGNGGVGSSRIGRKPDEGNGGRGNRRTKRKADHRRSERGERGEHEE